MLKKRTQLQSTEIQRRKNRHSNRKLQRFQKRCRANQMNNPFMEMFMTNDSVIQQFHPNDQKPNEEKDDEEEQQHEDEEDQIDNKTCLNQHQSMEENHIQQTKTAYLSIDIWKLSTKLIPNYRKFPIHQFKHILCQAIPDYHQQIHQYLTNPKLSSFIQQYAHFLSMIIQLEMEKDYWEYVINILSSAIDWLSGMPKDLTKRNSVSWDYPRTKHNIRHRQQLNENKLQKAKQELELLLRQYSFCWSMSKKTSMNQIISKALMITIQNGLQKLHTKFEQKKILMRFDAYDIHLIKSFYDFNPTEEQKYNVEKIWRANRKSSQRTIRQIKTKSIAEEQAIVQDDTSLIFNGTHRLYIDYDHEQDRVSLLESFNPTMRTIIETRQTNMEQRKQQILAFHNTTSSSQ